MTTQATPSFSSFPDFESESTGSQNHEKVDKQKRRKRQKKERLHKPSPPREITTAQGKGREDDALTDRLFYSDRRGDFLNIQFGGLHIGDVPKYQVVNNTRNILGLSNSMLIHRRAADGIEVGPSRYNRMSSLTDPGTRSLLNKNPERRILPLKSSNFGGGEEDIILLPSSKRSDKPEDSYRSITVDAPDSQTSSSENESSSSDEDGRPTLTAHQETLRMLEENIRSNPTSIDKWISLLHQTLSTIPATSKNATKVRCEITLSILSRAFAADLSNAKNKVLRVLYLKACEEVWQEDKIKAEWEKAFKDGNIEILMEWLEYQIRIGRGGLDGIISAAVKALGRLERDEDEISGIRIFRRTAFAIRAAGYTERATAMFQAQAELMFNMPPEISAMPFQSRLVELERFWDSEVPRLGEDGAMGWKSWYSSETSQVPAATPSLPSSHPDLDPYRDWARREALLDSKVWLPSRSDTETSDPQSTIFFSDIRPLLLDIGGRRGMEDFRLAWLSFLGLHLPGFCLSASGELDWDDRWSLEFLTRLPTLDAIFPSDGLNAPLPDAVAGVVIGRERQYNNPFGPVRCWGRGACGALDLASAEPGKSQQRGLWSQNDIADVDGNLVRNIFSSLRISQDDFEWDSLDLAFELADNPIRASKKSKGLLSNNQVSFSLWCLHAQLLRLRGRLDDARKVYQTVLIASHPNNSHPYIASMWWNWAEMEWLAGGTTQVLNIILKSVHLEGSNSGATILRGKRLLEELFDSSDLTNWRDAEAWIRLRVLLESLTGSVSSAFSVVDRYLTSPKSDTFHESLTTFSLLMVYHHGVILRNPVPPSILRDRVHAAFEMYHNNSIILGLLLESEKGQSIWGRLRKTLGANDIKAKDVARRVQQVWIAAWEKGRWISEIERTRNGLLAAVEHEERTRSSPIIWRIFIEFEIRAGELQRAKNLLYRAISENPMVKGLYLPAFGPLRSAFLAHELNALADTMAERGLRLHQGLDEVVGDTIVSENKAEEDYDMSDDEIEFNAKELKRLKPY